MVAWRPTRIELVFVSYLIPSMLVLAKEQHLVARQTITIITLLGALATLSGIMLAAWAKDVLRAAGKSVSVVLKYEYVRGMWLASHMPILSLLILNLALYMAKGTGEINMWLMCMGASLIPPTLVVQILVYMGVRSIKRSVMG